MLIGEGERMKKVGIRELKANLSRYMSEVKSGQGITITDRNHDFALILPLGVKGVEEKLSQLLQRGIADWSGGRPRGMIHRISSRGKKVSDAVIEGRR